MSIRDEINVHVRNGTLVHLQPWLPSDPVNRTMFIGEEILEIADPSTAADNWNGQREARVRGALDTFTAGRLISFGLNPHQKKTAAFMARVSPTDAGVCDIRVLDPRPGIRVFGCFSEPDVFIGLTWNYRENLERDDDWNAAANECRSEWDKLFPRVAPHIGTRIADYVTDRVYAV